MNRLFSLPLLSLLVAVAGRAEPELVRIPPKSPAESLKAFEVAKGFRVELVASEPLVQSPMACDWDEDGRLFVVELPEYNAYAAPGRTAVDASLCSKTPTATGSWTSGPYLRTTSTIRLASSAIAVESTSGRHRTSFTSRTPTVTARRTGATSS